MDAKYVLELTADKLYDEFIEAVLSDARYLVDIVTEVEQSKRYTDDFIFRIHVQTARQFILLTSRFNDELQQKGAYLIEKCEVLNLPLLLNLNNHIMGMCYKILGHFELSIEHFIKVLLNEKQLERKRLSSIVNFYIGDIYVAHFDNDNAHKYLTKAYQALEESKDWEPRYIAKKSLYNSVMCQLLYRTKKFDEIKVLFDEFLQHKDNTHPVVVLTFQISKLFYTASVQDYEETKKTLYDILKICRQDDHTRLYHIKTFLSMMIENNVDPTFYKDEIELAESMDKSVFHFLNYAIQRYCYHYYDQIGDEAKAIDNLLQSVDSLEKELLELTENKAQTFQIVIKNTSMEEDISHEQERSNELKLIAEEALRNKELAESAFRRLSFVSELGKKLTHSLNIKDIIDTVFTRLKESLPIEGFIVIVRNEEKKQLQSLVYYEFDQAQEAFTIDEDDSRSVFVETFKTKEIIKIDDFAKDKRFLEQQEALDKPPFRSIIFMPLSIEDEMIGAWSVQNSMPNIFTEEHLLFLQELMPYLSIALNNAIRSESLVKEIGKSRLTQTRLEKVNRKLEVLSTLDGLTQISNRRDFEVKIMDLIETSRKKELSISVFMFDIDHFKLYNDNYGHLEGDEALKSIATIINKHFREAGGISARFGGEEFIAACLNLSEEDSLKLADTIREEVLNLKLENRMAPLGILSISTGIAHTKALSKVRKSSLMRWADISLYNAKRTGKNKVVLKGLDSNEKAPEGLE